MRLALPALTGRTIALISAVAILFVAVPVATSIMRATTYSAQVSLRPIDVSDVASAPALSDARRHVGQVLMYDPPRAVAHMLVEPSLLEDVRVRRANRAFRLTATARTPEQARALALELARRTGAVATEELSQSIEATLAVVRETLSKRSVPRRRALERYEAALARAARKPPTRYVVAGEASAADPRTRLDRAIDGLPGPMPAAAHPLLAATAGLFAALTLLAAAAWGSRRSQHLVHER